MDLQTTNAWLCLSVLVAFVPFAVVAGIVDTWNTEGGRAFRASLTHPLRTYRVYRVTHAHAH